VDGEDLLAVHAEHGNFQVVSRRDRRIRIRVEKIDGEVGSAVTFTEVLLAGGDAIRIGTPLVEGVTVRGEIVAHARDKKVLIFKKKRRKNYRRRRGHRQSLTTVRVTEIA
jgi:large subunit ribosomal protein L21